MALKKPQDLNFENVQEEDIPLHAHFNGRWSKLSLELLNASENNLDNWIKVTGFTTIREIYSATINTRSGKRCVSRILQQRGFRFHIKKDLINMCIYIKVERNNSEK